MVLKWLISLTFSQFVDLFVAGVSGFRRMCPMQFVVARGGIHQCITCKGHQMESALSEAVGARAGFRVIIKPSKGPLCSLESRTDRTGENRDGEMPLLIGSQID
jgi:hypothetical protein